MVLSHTTEQSSSPTPIAQPLISALSALDEEGIRLLSARDKLLSEALAALRYYPTVVSLLLSTDYHRTSHHTLWTEALSIASTGLQPQYQGHAPGYYAQQQQPQAALPQLEQIGAACRCAPRLPHPDEIAELWHATSCARHHATATARKFASADTGATSAPIQQLVDDVHSAGDAANQQTQDSAVTLFLQGVLEGLDSDATLQRVSQQSTSQGQTCAFGGPLALDFESASRWQPLETQPAIPVPGVFSGTQFTSAGTCRATEALLQSPGLFDSLSSQPTQTLSHAIRRVPSAIELSNPFLDPKSTHFTSDITGGTAFLLTHTPACQSGRASVQGLLAVVSGLHSTLLGLDSPLRANPLSQPLLHQTQSAWFHRATICLEGCALVATRMAVAVAPDLAGHLNDPEAGRVPGSKAPSASLASGSRLLQQVRGEEGRPETNAESLWTHLLQLSRSIFLPRISRLRLYLSV